MTIPIYGRVRWLLSSIFSCRVVLIHSLSCRNEMPSSDAKSRCRFSKLTEFDIPDLMHFHDTFITKWNFIFSRDEVSERLRRGHRCYLARRDGDIVGCYWVAFDSVYSPDLRCTFVLSEGCFADYNLFARPDCRGEGITQILRGKAFTELRQEGYETCYDYLSSRNTPIIKCNKKSGAVTVGRIYYGYLFGCYYLLSVIPRKEGIRVGRVEDCFFRWRKLLKKRCRGSHT